jgi:cell division initiation protein
MITPMDIHNKTFSGQIRGYSKDEVNAFLEELASDYEKIYREHRAMEEEMDIIRTKLRNYEKMESTMSHTLVMAQETADNVKKNAHKEAELSIQEAQSEAQKIVSDAEAARRKMNADLLKAEGDMNLYIEKLLSNFKSALALIEAAKAEKYYDTAKEQIAALENDFTHSIDRDMDLFKDEITSFLTEQFIQRYYYLQGVIEYKVQHDQEVAKAVEVLNDKEVYRNTLKPVK